MAPLFTELLQRWALEDLRSLSSGETTYIGSSQDSLRTSFEYNAAINVLSEQQNKLKAWNLDLLNVTGMTFHRRDGHSSLYYLGPKVGQAPLHTKTATTGVSLMCLIHGVIFCMPPSSKRELACANFSKQTSGSPTAWQLNRSSKQVTMLSPTFQNVVGTI